MKLSISRTRFQAFKTLMHQFPQYGDCKLAATGWIQTADKSYLTCTIFTVFLN